MRMEEWRGRVTWRSGIGGMEEKGESFRVSLQNILKKKKKKWKCERWITDCEHIRLWLR